jgi:hypothetical protein
VEAIWGGLTQGVAVHQPSGSYPPNSCIQSASNGADSL